MGIIFWQLLALRSEPFEGQDKHDIPGLVMSDQRPYVDAAWDPGYAQVRRKDAGCGAVFMYDIMA